MIKTSGCCTKCHKQSKNPVEPYLKNLTCTACNHKTLVGKDVYERMFPTKSIVWNTHKCPASELSEARVRKPRSITKIFKEIQGEYGEV